MAKRIGICPVMKFYNSDGTVLASGTVETYTTGTSNTKNSYTDSAGSGSATSFTLDSNGEAVRYFDTDEDYKLIIKDSSGSTVRTVDPYVPVPAPHRLDNDLDVNGNSIVSRGGRDIQILPNGSGNIILDNHTWPNTDGTANQVIQTDGAGTLSWTSVSAELLSDTTPQLGANLDTNSYNIQFDTGKGILDAAGNEQILFTQTTSAVNYINVTNAATGSGPEIAAAGSDANIDLNLSAKGSGTVVINGISYPTADGTANDVMITDGSANLSFVDINTLVDAPTAASQAEMEAATSTSVYATPNNVKHHPGVAKGWVIFQTDGTILASYNVSSISNVATGSWTVNWDTAFSSTSYPVIGMVLESTSNLRCIQITSQAASSVAVDCFNPSGTLVNPDTAVYIAAFGDQ